MIPYLLVAAGGAVGSVARFAMVNLIDERIEGGFPFGTLTVNVVGSLLIGLFAGLTDRPWLQQLLIVGVLGGYTTFSSFSLQTVRLLQSERWIPACAYVAGSIVLCLVGTVIGLRLAHFISTAKPT